MMISGWCWYQADVDSGLMVYGGWWLMSKLGFFAADFQLCRSKTLLWVSALESSEIFSIPGCNVTIINLCWSPRYFSRSCQMIFFCGRWLWGSVRSRGRRWLVATKLLPPRSTTRWDFTDFNQGQQSWQWKIFKSIILWMYGVALGGLWLQWMYLLSTLSLVPIVKFYQKKLFFKNTHCGFHDAV